MSRFPSPDRTVREEAAILRRLGWTYHGMNSAGHHTFEHVHHGSLHMSSTPRNPKRFRLSHRADVAKRMGLSLWQFERQLAGQSTAKTARRPRKHRQAQRPVVRLAAVAPAERPPVRPAADLPQTETWGCGHCHEVVRPGHVRYWEEVACIRAHQVCTRCWTDRIFWKEAA